MRHRHHHNAKLIPSAKRMSGAQMRQQRDRSVRLPVASNSRFSPAVGGVDLEQELIGSRLASIAIRAA
jgi:hypothetical protein